MKTMWHQIFAFFLVKFAPCVPLSKDTSICLEWRRKGWLTLQIGLQEPQLALIHIPIQLYSFLLQPILRLLFGEDHDEDAAKVPWTSRHDFLNVSITPVECSVICTRQLADRFIRPAAEVLNKIYASDKKSKSKKEVHISPDDFIVVQVDGQGLDAGQRVLELTSPLAMIGMYAVGPASHSGWSSLTISTAASSSSPPTSPTISLSPLDIVEQ